MPSDSTALRRWPLATLLMLGLVLLVLVPIAAVVWVNARDVERQSLERETIALEHRAAEAARRVEERVGRLRAYVEHVATNPAIVTAVSGAPGKSRDVIAQAQVWDDEHPEIHELLVSVRDANPWFRNVYLLSEAGVCISSSERGKTPAMVGRVYDYRPYFRAPVDNAAPFVSDVLKNATSTGTGIFVSAPIIADGEVLAVAVLKVDSFALHDIVADLSQRAGRSLLVDRFGVVVSDATEGHVQTVDREGSLQFRPLSDVARYLPRFEETKRYGDPSGENYLDRIAQPLGLTPLWAELRTQASGASEFALPAAKDQTRPMMVGYSPVWSLASEPYGYIVLAEASSTFREPLLDLGRDALVRFAVVVAAILLIAMIALRRVSRRVQTLRAAVAVSTQRERPISHDGLPVASASAPMRIAVVDRLQRCVRPALADAEAKLARHDDDELQSTKSLLAEGLDQLDSTILVGPGEPELELTRRRVDLRTLLDEAIDRARSAAQLHQTKVVLELQGLGDDDEREVTTDPRKLGVVLGNLLDNACRYTRRGTVTVAVERSDDHVDITITDTGIGMTKKQLQRALDPFDDELGDDTPTLGVVLASRGAELLGGAVELTSAPDAGTTARVRLPLA